LGSQHAANGGGLALGGNAAAEDLAAITRYCEAVADLP
jgi:hypothetical protein